MGKKREATVLSYFKREKKWLALTTVTGLIYNVGMTAAPWFEGEMAQYLYDILNGRRAGWELVLLALAYVLSIVLVQGMRALKRLFVRKFSNDVLRSMKRSVYHHLVQEPVREVHREDTGTAMTRALTDAEACAEGMRKFTTEIFDTGVVMVSYLTMLFLLDWRMTLVVILFPPAAYIASAKLKGKVVSSTAAARGAMSRLNDAAVDAAARAVTYRAYGEETNRGRAYEAVLGEYERKNAVAGIWQNSPQPVYRVISLIGVIPILWLGGANVLGSGWAPWSIAVFSSFLACFLRLATKSSHAAKLFNAVQKARASWQRIRGYLTEEERVAVEIPAPRRLTLEHAGLSYGAGGFALHDLNFTAEPETMTGITGRVASGKSTFGKLFLCEESHTGRILYGGQEITAADSPVFAYAGHDPELFTGTVRDNVTFGRGNEKRLAEVLAEVQIEGEVTPDTPVGREGSGLSGGQQARLALARALYSEAPVLILDDPLASVDAGTERNIFAVLREKENWRTILLISHRLTLFPLMDQVVFIEGGTLKAGSHEEMMKVRGYAELYERQREGAGE